MAARTEPLTVRVGRRVVAAFCSRQVRRHVDLTVLGRDNLPPTGPVVIAARHVHHLLDGCVLAGQIDRPLHVFVAVDWAPPGPQRTLLDLATGLLRWPAIIRSEVAARHPAGDASRRLRAATREAIALLQAGQALIVFPEGYPNIDPHPTPKRGITDMLCFQPGFVRIAVMAAGGSAGKVPIVPAGFWYEALAGNRWRVILRFGEPVYAEGMRDTRTAAAVERCVRELSRAPELHGTPCPAAYSRPTRDATVSGT
ncbi:MAG: 1-acyl-sn-glycerol-3-phosphate acyltransferase [Chloroflexota bacterium]|nr:1-acyl-sn-glycerol-3-phosphate acyltransferase [Chloroflexia bacterium]MDQ3227728.1 1-acyl-sn-glycerol-3-phosphate acyltransferase [Chloroflexota bacterium]